jgi:hypothetical protein
VSPFSSLAPQVFACSEAFRLRIVDAALLQRCVTEIRLFIALSSTAPSSPAPRKFAPVECCAGEIRLSTMLPSELHQWLSIKAV